jgi:nicotinamidase-related amidase
MDMTLDPKTTAFVLIDLQKGIVGRPLAPHCGASVVEKSVALARRLSELGGTVVAVHVAFSNPDADRLKQPVDASWPMPPGGYPAEFSELATEIAALNADVIITKRGWTCNCAGGGLRRSCSAESRRISAWNRPRGMRGSGIIH